MRVGEREKQNKEFICATFGGGGGGGEVRLFVGVSRIFIINKYIYLYKAFFNLQMP